MEEHNIDKVEMTACIRSEYKNMKKLLLVGMIGIIFLLNGCKTNSNITMPPPMEDFHNDIMIVGSEMFIFY